MKIPASVRRLYDDQRLINDRLKPLVDVRMSALKNPWWHYVSRVKELSSFALKLESGRCRVPAALEDFFACTLVVANATEIDEAERRVRGRFIARERRPRMATQTHKRAEAFPFDDLRLYVTLSEAPVPPPEDLRGVVFEVQIKTFLQHAWSVATHDLVYKTDDANWSKARIAYQIKAMLEHAEVSILEADGLAACAVLAKEDPRTAAIRAGIALVRSQWDADALPANLQRLSDNIRMLLDGLRLDTQRLAEILNDRRARRGGSHPANLSPYATIVQYLFDAERDRMVALLTNRGLRTRVLIPEEIDLPAGVDRRRLTNAVFVGAEGAG